MPPGNCPECGASAKPLAAGPHPTYILRDTQLSSLQHLFQKRTDYVHCEACGAAIQADTAVVVQCSDSPTALVGTDSKDHGVLHSISSLSELPPSFAVESFNSLDDLRSRVSEHVLQAVPLVQTLLATPPDSFDALIVNEWRALTPFVLNVGRLLASAEGPELLKIPSITERQSVELARRLSAAQARAWSLLTLSWASTHITETSLDADLDHFVCPDVLLPNAADHFLDAVSHEQFPVNADNPIARYVTEAVIACVCAATNRENPRQSSWGRAYFEFELALNSGPATDEVDLDHLERRRISSDRANALITYNDAWKNFAIRLSSDTKVPDRMLRTVATRCGYEAALDGALWERRVTVSGPQSQATSVEEIIQVLFGVALDPEQQAQFLFALDFFLNKLISQSRVNDLMELGRKLADIMTTDQAKAQLYAKLGKCFKTLRAPHQFLELIGEDPQSWEANLPSGDQAYLWTERANALQLMGHYEAALSWMDRILQGDTSSLSAHDVRIALLNRAIFLRETGSPDLAYRELSELRDRAEQPDEQVLIGMALAITLVALGRHTDAQLALQATLKNAVPPWNTHAQLVRANLAAVSALCGDTDELMRAITEYLDNTSEPSSGDSTQTTRSQPGIDREFLVLASALAVHWEERQDRRDRFRHVHDEILAVLPDVQAHAEARGDTPLFLHALLFEASLAEPNESHGAWQRCYDAHTKHSIPQRAEVLLALSQSAFARSAVPEARRTLMAVPQAFTDEFGGALDLSETALAPIRLEGRLNALLRHLRSKSDDASYHQDLRLVAELKRNAVAHAIHRRRRDRVGFQQLDDMSSATIEDALARLVASGGPLTVLEWIDDGRSTNLLLTSTQDSQPSRTTWLELPNIDANDVGRRLTLRLANWRPSRKGDPFDLPTWRSLSEWLSDALDSATTGSHHVVVINSPTTNLVPWHVAIAPSRSVSYASSWTEIIELSGEENQRSHPSIGVVSVPRFRESNAVSRAFRESVKRTTNFAQDRVLDLRSSTGVDCDSYAFGELLANSTIAKILCHGFVDSETAEVAFMLSHEGALPLAHSVAAASRTAQSHRLSWRECQQLSPVPAVLFSIACSTGFSHTAGLGDQLGFHSAFRNGGGRALVAPRWDVVVPEVLPAMDAALESYLDHQHTLAKAVQHACSTLAASHPPWISWALCVEGDWR